METTNQNPSPSPGRRAFVFYTNWYTDVVGSLTAEQVDEFILIIVRYATFGTLPDADATPVVRTMFGLIRNAIDADLKKYDAMVERNRAKAEASAAKRRSTLKARVKQNIDAQNDAAGAQNADDGADVAHGVDIAGNQGQRRLEPILNTQHSELNTQHSELSTQHSASKAEKEEEAPVRREDVEAFWQEHGYKSSSDEFYDYYERHHWITTRGLPVRSWQRAAVMWEDKFRRDVLPARRREAMAEAQMRREATRVESEEIRRTERLSREAEEDRRAARAVGPDQSMFMFRRAVSLCNGNEDRAIDLMRRAPDDPALFRRLNEGFGGGKR